MGTHAKYSPSAAGKWANCPGYMALFERTVSLFGEEPSSAAAAEGTEAHEVAAEILSARNPTRALRELNADIELKSAIEYYVDMVEFELDRLTAEGLNPVMHIETRLGATETLFGTADCLIVHDKGLMVVDYKHGRGVFVAADSLQLKIYGYLAAKTHKIKAGSEITLCIVQPRYRDAERIRKAVFSLEALMGEVEPVIKKAVLGEKSNKEYAPGEHCLFCYAKPFCPKKKELIVEASKIENIEEVESLKFILDNAEEIQSTIKKAHGIAIQALEKGKIAPEQLGKGLKKCYGHRTWAHPGGEEKLAPLLRRHGVDKNLIWNKKLISPAQAEKLLKDKKWAVKYIKKEEKGAKLVDLGEADLSLTGGVAKQLGEYEAKTEKEKEKEKEKKQLVFDSADF